MTYLSLRLQLRYGKRVNCYKQQRILNTVMTFRPKYAHIDVLDTRSEAEIAKAFII
jgi:hypothetical protein